MKIAIIGSGNVGAALAESMVRAGHSVTISSSDPSSARAAADKVGAAGASSNAEAVQNAEVVILAVPAAAVNSVVKDAGTALDGKIVVDVTNRVDPEHPERVLDGSSNAERIQEQLPAAKVVKAFNSQLAARHADPVVEGIEVDGYVAADDPEAKRTVLELVESIGFRPIDAGGLAMARALEAMALLNITLQIRFGWPWQSGWRLIGPSSPTREPEQLVKEAVDKVVDTRQQQPIK